MSVLITSTKQAMYAEIERLRTECARLESLLIPVVTQQPEVKRDKSIFIEAAQKQRAEFAAARTEFVIAWCKANGKGTCPGAVVAEWAALRK